MQEDSSKLEKRKQLVLNFLKTKKRWIIFGLLILILYIGINIRTQNLNLLKDQTTNDYIPADPDAMIFERYVKVIDKEGSLPETDFKRNYPLGINMKYIDAGVVYFSYYLYKIAHFFVSEVTIGFSHSVLYPVIASALGLIFFFLLVKLVFNNFIALLSTAFLTVIPTYVTRTISGLSDKEPLGMLLIFAILYFYVKSLKSEKTISTISSGLIAGILTGLLSLTWGGVIFIVTILPFAYLIILLLKEHSKQDLLIYVCWFTPVFISIGLLTTKYGGIKTFFTSYVYIIPLAVLVYSLVILILKKYFKDKLPKNLPLNFTALLITIILGVLFLTIILGISKFINEISGFIAKLSTITPNRWAETIAENRRPFFTDWSMSYTLLYFLLSILGLFFLFFDTFKQVKALRYKLLGIFLIFILSFIFSSYSQSSILNGKTAASKLVYFGGILIFLIVSIYLYLKSYKKSLAPVKELPETNIPKKEVQEPVNKKISILDEQSLLEEQHSNKPYEDKSKIKKIKEIEYSNAFQELILIKKEYILIFVFFIVTMFSAKLSLRFLFTFSPALVITASYSIFKLFERIRTFKFTNKKIGLILSILFILVILLTPLEGSLIHFTKNSYTIAKEIGPTYSKQWQNAMKWVRENTSENAVFAHWWDYGYLVQDGADRATILDGGNVLLYWNHLLGRHVLLGQNETEALEFLYAHNATHLLITKEEVEKYPAYSSIGSDENYDRYSKIRLFTIDPKLSKEMQNSTLLVYKGSAILDQDLIINDKLIPNGMAEIRGIITIVNKINQTNKTEALSFEQPKAILVYNEKQFSIPINCLYLQGNIEKFSRIKNSLNSCIRFLPKLEKKQKGISSFEIDALLYISPKVHNTLFSQLYLFDNKKDWPHFKKVYDPSVTPNEYKIWSPLGIFNNQLVGPIKIWEISYPKDIKFKPEYLNTTYPNQKLQIPININN